MPFALILVGIVLVVAAVRNTSDVLFTTVKGDFTGTDNFAYWLVSILIIGALGYIKPLAPLSRAFLALLVVVLFLSNGGFFSKFNQQVFGGQLAGRTGGTVFGAGIGSILGNITGNLSGSGSIQSGGQ